MKIYLQRVMFRLASVTEYRPWLALTFVLGLLAISMPGIGGGGV